MFRTLKESPGEERDVGGPCELVLPVFVVQVENRLMSGILPRGTVASCQTIFVGQS